MAGETARVIVTQLGLKLAERRFRVKTLLALLAFGAHRSPLSVQASDHLPIKAIVGTHEPLRRAIASAGLISGKRSAEKPGMMPGARCAMVATEYVSCEICRREIPSSGAVMAEVREYVAYFCGLECYEKWVQQHAREVSPPAAVPASR